MCFMLIKSRDRQTGRQTRCELCQLAKVTDTPLRNHMNAMYASVFEGLVDIPAVDSDVLEGGVEE